jgi:hypothetical protein
MANGNDEKSLSGLPMGALIGGPLVAAAQAQVMLARSTMEFINTVGFYPDGAGTGSGEPRYVDFKFERPVQEWQEAQSADPDGQTASVEPPTEIVEIQVPLLALVQVPNLQIDTLDIEFNFELRTVDTESESEKSGQPDGNGNDGEGQIVDKSDFKLYGMPSAQREHTRKTDKTAKYHVQLHAVDKGVPETLARIIDMMASSVAPRKIKPRKVVENSTSEEAEL